jgi:hypothetical protein
VCVFFYTLFPSYTIKRTSFYTGILFLLLTGFSLAAALSVYGRETEETAIVMVRSTNLLSEPETGSYDSDSATAAPTAKTTVHAGSKLLIIDRIGNYYKVQLPNGEKGWIAAGDVALVLPADNWR